MSGVGVLDKVMAILAAFPDGTTRLEPSEIAERLGISVPTAYRLMAGMAEHRLLAPGRGGYRLGAGLIRLGAKATEGVEARRVALPFMKELRDATGETVELQIRTGYTRVPIEMIVGHRTVRTMGEIGVPLPIHVGASSRVLLAWMDEEEAMALARRSSEENHPAGRPPWSPQAYRRRLRVVRRQGWEFSRGERDPETSAVSVPVFDRIGDVVAAVIVSSTATRFAEEAHRSDAIARARECGSAVSLALGFSDEVVDAAETVR
ncbi:IclR family transcriptional regulator [Segeticoccus rhizosphaerae]|uniref:IclR family transcriptional regulator n=1 Tax=Segeticoccus rhizosphaerae TaxID=1104777 RepID=UPI0010C035DE|nr:IclR family transcriptional regulator [Ornithinicoccus soli]